MKKNLHYLLITVVLLLVLINTGTVKVMSTDIDFSTESFSKEDEDRIIRNINITLLLEEPSVISIKCFDVNEVGEFAIGFSRFEDRIVCVYTGDGVFKYGYSFKGSGSFGLELQQDSLTIFLVRSDAAVVVEPGGEIKSVSKILNLSENNSNWNKSVFTTVRKVGENTYKLSNNMGIFNIFATSYSCLTVTDANGTEKVLCDLGGEHMAKSVMTFVGVILFMSIVTTIVVLQFIRSRRAYLEK